MLYLSLICGYDFFMRLSIRMLLLSSSSMLQSMNFLVASSYLWLWLFHAPLSQNATSELILHAPEHDFFTPLQIKTWLSCSCLLSLAMTFSCVSRSEWYFEFKLHAPEHDFFTPLPITTWLPGAISYLWLWLFHASLNQNATFELHAPEHDSFTAPPKEH